MFRHDLQRSLCTLYHLHISLRTVTIYDLSSPIIELPSSFTYTNPSSFVLSSHDNLKIKKLT